jgi:hypothetical protein
MQSAAFYGRKPHHLRSVKEKLPRTALAGIERKFLDRLPEQVSERAPRHLIPDVEREKIDDLSAVHK